MKGLFFGSFDPPHIGHVNVVTTALNSNWIDEVEVIPAFKSVWKNTETPFDLRLQMCEETFKDIPNVKVNSVEYLLANNEPLPTYKVIDYLKSQYDNFKIIMTNETYAELPRWNEGERLIKENNFIIVCTAHFYDPVDISGDVLYAPDITMCSTSLRKKIKEGKLVQPFINTNVLNIINSNNLYK